MMNNNTNRTAFLPVYWAIVFCCLLTPQKATFGQSNPVPGEKQSKSILIMNCTAHIGNGQVIENALVGFTGGKFTLVADATLVRIDVTNYDEIIDASGKHLYPGFIAPNSVLGLHEVDQARATLDEREIGSYKPSIRSVIAYNTDSEIIPTVRSNGILMAQITPRGGVVSGNSSVVQLDAWNWEDAIIRPDDGIHLNWPAVVHRMNEKGKPDVERAKSYNDELREIKTLFYEAKAYSALVEPPVTEIRYEGLRGIFDGSKTLYVHAGEYNQIAEALQFKKDLNIPGMVIIDGYDSWKLAEQLKLNNVGVMLRRVHDLPEYNEDDVLLPYKLPKMLYDAGVLFCLQNDGDKPAMGTRNLPFYAGTAVAYGLPYEEAVKALTYNAAVMLGIDGTCGSVETGKDATFFISNGDALDMRTNDLTGAWIQGRQIKLTNKQLELYMKYKNKYDREK